MYGILNELEQNDALDFEMRSIIGCLRYMEINLIADNVYRNKKKSPQRAHDQVREAEKGTFFMKSQNLNITFFVCR